MNNKDFQLTTTGNSGCQLLIVEDPLFHHTNVRKLTTNSDYIPRLIRQAQKQKDFLYTNQLAFVTSPRIFSENCNNQSYYFDMEYIKAFSYMEFILTSTKQQIDLFIDQLLQVMQQNMEQSTWEPVNVTVIFQKIIDLTTTLFNHPLVDQPIAAWLNKLMLTYLGMADINVKLPVGSCHGDLTLSNILFNPDASQIALLDFRDTFYETPLQDYAKIRQDTCFRYCLQMTSTDVPNAVTKILAYMDTQLVEQFVKYDFCREWYSLFQLINLVQIIPCAQQASLVNFVIDIIQTHWGNEHELDYSSRKTVIPFSQHVAKIDAHASQRNVNGGSGNARTEFAADEPHSS